MISDTLKPRWQHSSPDVRAAAVAELTDQQVLLSMVNNDPSQKVREKAVRRIEDHSVLIEIAGSDPDICIVRAALQSVQERALLRNAAFTKLSWQVVREILQLLFDTDSINEVIEKSDDEEILLLIAKKGDRSNRSNVLEKADSGEFLARLAMETFDSAVLAKFLKTVQDEKLRRRVLAQCMGSLNYQQLKDIGVCPFCHSGLNWEEHRYTRRERGSGDSFYFESETIETSYAVHCENCNRFLAEGDTAFEV
jgi:hypothetical protein